MVIKAVVITENGKPVKCIEVVEFNTVEKFNEMVELCKKNEQLEKQAVLREKSQTTNKFYNINKKMSEIERKVENNTKLIMGESEDEQEENN